MRKAHREAFTPKIDLESFRTEVVQATQIIQETVAKQFAAFEDKLIKHLHRYLDPLHSNMDTSMELQMRHQTESLSQVLEKQHERLEGMALSGDAFQRQILELTRSIISAVDLHNIGTEKTLQHTTSRSLLSEPPTRLFANLALPSPYVDPSLAHALGNTLERDAMQGINQTKDDDDAEGLAVAWRKSWMTSLRDNTFIRVNVELIWADASKVDSK